MPVISVIMPVYNAGSYLREAIDSILSQTFSDFEFIIINDGSTDGSDQIICSYKDERIRYVRNEGNKGLISSLNRGIDEANGTYIARMDSDDISFPERFEKQVLFLEKNDVAVLATRVKLIEANGKPLPDWKEDCENVAVSQIKQFLRRDNCIAHPSVMGKKTLFQQYRYQHNQKYSEDYDLWLRLLADGHRIAKLEEPLLYYRILPTSVTHFKKFNVFFRLAKVKFRFLWERVKLRKLSGYVFSIFFYACYDLLKAGGKEIKTRLKI